MEPIKSYCQRCDFKTNQSILYIKKYRSEDEDYDYAEEYMVLRCNGCDTISFRKDFIDIENSYPDIDGDWKTDTTTTLYPGEKKNEKILNNFYLLPDKIIPIYQEAINSFNANCPILTGVAFRAIIEAICIQENITGNNLEKKINNLVKQKLITEKEANRLHSIRFIGNDSVHEMKIPKEESLKIVLNIIVHLLNNLYLIDKESEGLLETVVDKFTDFEEMLNECINKLTEGIEVPIAFILGKNLRRLNGKINDLESELKIKIQNGEYTNLAIGKFDTYGNDTIKRQLYIIKNNNHTFRVID